MLANCLFKPLIVPGKLDYLSTIYNYVNDTAVVAGFSETSVYRLKQAVDEIVTNIITHGYIANNEEGDIRVQAKLTKNAFKIFLIDSAKPYNFLKRMPLKNLELPFDRKKPGGFGIYLALNLVDKIHYRSIGNANLCILTLWRPTQIMLKPEDIMINETFGTKILVIADDSIHTKNLIADLKTLNYQPILLSNINQLKTLNTLVLSIIFIDVSYLERRGYDLLRCLKQDKTLSKVPIVVLVENEKINLLEGVEDYLTKNYSINFLQLRINSILQKIKLRERIFSELSHMKKFVEIGIALSAVKDFDQLSLKILSEAKAICNADGGTLYIHEGNYLKSEIVLNDTLKIHSVNIMTSSTQYPFLALPLYNETHEPNTKNMAAFVVLFGKTVNIADLYNEKNFNVSGVKEFDKMHHYHTLSVLSIPLKNHLNEVIGVLQLINARDLKTSKNIPFDSNIQKIAEAFASQGAVVLNTRILLERQKEFFRYERELQIAQEIQKNFLPESLPEHKGWELAASFMPAYEAAGDFYDIFTQDKHIRFIIADVTDKGIGSAMFMALFRTLIRAFSEGEKDDKQNLAHIVTLTNNYVLHNHAHSNMFATLFLGELDPETGVLTYVNAGHPMPFILNENGIKMQLHPTGPAVGVFLDIEFEQQQVMIQPEDSFFAFTDGVTDAKDMEENFFTQEKLLQLLNNPPGSATLLLDRIATAVKSFMGKAQQFDDITMLALTRLC